MHVYSSRMRGINNKKQRMSTKGGTSRLHVLDSDCGKAVNISALCVMIMIRVTGKYINMYVKIRDSILTTNSEIWTNL